jgi:8-oxo-dGTP pyrophosphatase MutT (NUDIX family)
MMDTSPQIRTIAVCVVRENDCLFVSEGFDSVKKTHFYRPLGGSLEPGEQGWDTVKREFQEELDTVLTEVSHIGTLENQFTWNGQQGHEFVLVFEGKFADASIYQKKTINVVENGQFNFKALWKPLSDFQQDATLLVPKGILEMLENHWNRS